MFVNIQVFWHVRPWRFDKYIFCLANEELNDFYSSPNIVRGIKSRRMRLAGHVSHMGRGESYTGFWWGNRREREHLRDPGVGGNIILWWIFRKWDVGAWTGSSWLRIGTGGGHLWMQLWTFSSSSSSIGTTAHCGLWPVEQCPSIFSYLPPTLSIFSLPALEDLFLLPLSTLSWSFPFFSSLPVLEWISFWASYPPFSLGALTSLSFALLSILLYFLLCSSLLVLDSSDFSIPRFHI